MPRVVFVCLLLLSALSICSCFFSNAKSVSSLKTMKLSMALKGRALVIQNKGGGHGTIGYYLCKTLLEENKGFEVVMLQDKCKKDKVPFSLYPELEKMGVKIIETSLTGASSSPEASLAAVAGMDFNYVVDNWSKNAGNATFVSTLAKSSKTEQLLFISSAGMYKTSGLSPIVETDPVKNNDARAVETTMAASGVPFTFLRPQYIYGENSNKRYLDYFIGRAYRQLPIPLPLSGEQLVCLTHVEDVARLIATALGHPKALGEVFNCGTDRYITYKGLSQLIHTTLGHPAEDSKHMYYEPKLFDHWDGKGAMEFPFRRETFITTPSKAKTLLGWKPIHSLQSDMAAEVKEYEQTGGFKEEWGMEELKYDLEIIASKDSTFTFTYPFLDNAGINMEKKPYGFQSA